MPTPYGEPVNGYVRPLFVSAALFNLAVGLTLLFAASLVMPLLGTEAPQNPTFLHLFALLILMFGLSYFWISRAPQQETSLMALGAIAKGCVFLMIFYYHMRGLVGWQLTLLATVDLIYAVLFTFARRSVIRQLNSRLA